MRDRIGTIDVTAKFVASITVSVGLDHPLLVTMRYRPSGDQTMFNGRSPIGEVPAGRCDTPPVGQLRHAATEETRPARRWRTELGDGDQPGCCDCEQDSGEPEQYRGAAHARDDMSNVLRTCCPEPHGLQSLHHADSSTIHSSRCRAGHGHRCVAEAGHRCLLRMQARAAHGRSC